jgi:phosphatidylserine/phosphatidylglycerophosphate/cardiolipin synthase-like enzyme
MVRVIGSARKELVLSLFRCDDFTVLDALAAALARGVRVRAILTTRARGGQRRLRRLWASLEEMGVILSCYADPVVKYHAKYLVADDGPAIVTTLNPTRKCFTRTWDALLVTSEPELIDSLRRLFEADVAGKPLRMGPQFSRRLIVGPESARSRIRGLIGSARRSIRIVDHKLSDPDVVTLLRERREAGVTVTVIGRSTDGIVSHGKLMTIDEERAVIGSVALSTLSLDFRREVAVVIDDASLVRRLNGAVRDLGARVGVSSDRLPGDPV